jgi:hypothetical protein
MFPVVLFVYTILFKRILERGMGGLGYPFFVWIVGLLVPVYLGFLYYKQSLINQLLIMIFLAFDELAVLILPLLAYHQTNHIVLIVISYYRYKGNLIRFVRFVGIVIIVYISLHILDLCLQWQHVTVNNYITCAIKYQTTPQIY